MQTENIIHEDQMVATIIYKEDINPGICFYTPDTSSLQVAKHLREQGEKIPGHRHLPVKISRDETLKEILYIEEGKMRVTFYTDDGESIEEKVLNQGDMVLLISGGHGFEFIEKTKMIEVKQGPYNPACRKALPEQK